MTAGRFWRLFVGVLAIAALAGCGGDDGDPPSGGDGTEPATPADVEADVEPGADGDLGPIATGLRASLRADRVEVDGNTIHIYLEESDRIVAGAGSECLVAGRVVPDGTTVVLHRDGVETTC